MANTLKVTLVKSPIGAVPIVEMPAMQQPEGSSRFSKKQRVFSK